MDNNDYIISQFKRITEEYKAQQPDYTTDQYTIKLKVYCHNASSNYLNITYTQLMDIQRVLMINEGLNDNV